MLQSVAVENRFCAVAVESPFSTAHEMSYERVSGPLHLGPWFGHTLGRPIIWAAVVYARFRYGFDLLQPSPLKAVAHSSVPVLLIGGEEDTATPLAEAALMKQHIPNARLEVVPRAGHYAAFEQPEYVGRLLRSFVDGLSL